VFVQLLPWPAAFVQTVSPQVVEVGRTLELSPSVSAWRSLSLDRGATLWAWCVLVGGVTLFWGTRAQLREGGVRRLVRLVSLLGLLVSLLAIAQAATAGRAIYWRFPTEFEGPLPFGPFVNRNHFATWVIMALPLCFGYIAARAGVHAHGAHLASARERVARRLDPRSGWLLAAATSMLLALFLSLSRSALFALALSALLTVGIGRRRGKRPPWMLVTAGGVLLAALLWSDVPAMSGRMAAVGTALDDRLIIWRETLPIVRDFWAVGTGSGTYQTAMLVYQRADRSVYFNQAHNHYLQVLAEGGLAMTAIVIVALAAGLRGAAARMREVDAGLWWIRGGAACGLAAVAFQSVWETGLVMPANAALAAILAAILLHERRAGLD
jgi:O-antigen ligase